MVLVYSQHAPGSGEGEGGTLVPESDSVVFDEERSKRVADLVCVVSVRDVQAHQDKFLSVCDRVDSELLEGPGEEHIGEHDMRLEEKAVYRPSVEL